ncbi:MAG: head-tail connector protein [Dyella sp.]
MSLTDISIAAAHVRADSDDTTQLQIYLDAAEDAAWQYLGRLVVKDSDALIAAITASSSDLAAANAAYGNAIALASAMPPGITRDAAFTKANAELSVAKSSALEACTGIVINPSITAAILLTTGHLYANRENVMAGTTAAAIALPFGAQSLLMPYRAGLGV